MARRGGWSGGGREAGECVCVLVVVVLVVCVLCMFVLEICSLRRDAVSLTVAEALGARFEL